MRVPAFFHYDAHAFRALCLMCVLVFAAACRREMPAQEPQPAALTLAQSGMAATYHPPANDGANPPPGVVLIHDLGDDRTAWDVLASRLTREGFAVLTLDLPGHGASPGDWRAMDGDDWLTTAERLDDALRALADAGADPMRIAYVGAGLGANLALTAAHRARDAAALVLVSPGWEIQGVDVRGIVGGLEHRPVLLMAAEGDSYATATANGMKAEAPGFSELRLYPGTLHGVGLLDTSEHAREQLIEWLKLILL